MKIGIRILLSLFLFQAPFALGQTSTVGEVPSQATSAISQSGAGSVIAPQSPSVVSINPAATTGQASQNSGSGANNGAGAALIASGVPMLAKPPTAPIGAMLIAMGLLALAQGGADSGAADQSGTTAATSSSTNATPVPTPSADGGMAAAFSTPAGQQAIGALQQAGGSVSADGVTMPDGTTQPWSAFSSPGAMTAAGMDPTAAMAVVKDVEKKIGASGPTVVSMGAVDGAGGSGHPMFPTGTDDFKINNPFALTAAQKAKMIAGKTVNYGSDPIGVSMDDLFAMVHRVYEKKSAANGFIDPSGIAKDSPAREPASLKGN